jgi:methyl-accepting chemotaxis protein
MSFKRKMLLLSLLPVLVLAVLLSLGISFTLLSQAEQEVGQTRERLLQESRSRLTDYAAIARTAVADLYASASAGDLASRAQAIARLSQIKYAEDGYFIGYDS